nr:MAG TPA: hypothetical protein [Caudoviricetes sp.]
MRVSAPPTSGGINIIALYLPVGNQNGGIFAMNKENTIQELLDQIRSSTQWVKTIAGAYLGVSPDDVVITAKEGAQG